MDMASLRRKKRIQEMICTIMEMGKEGITQDVKKRNGSRKDMG